MGIEQIQKIHEFGEINVIISLLLCAMLVIALRAGWEKLLNALGLETKASLQKKALEQKLSDMEQKIADFEQSQHDYHNQSISIRDKLEDNQKVLQDGINELKTLLIDKEIDVINEIEGIENVEPMTHCLDDFEYVLREDEVEESVPIEDLLLNCDDTSGSEVRVPRMVG